MSPLHLTVHAEACYSEHLQLSAEDCPLFLGSTHDPHRDATQTYKRISALEAVLNEEVDGEFVNKFYQVPSSLG